ncbi:MAG: hypothetical protein ACQEQ0_02620 [Bacteroidota bacterium]
MLNKSNQPLKEVVPADQLMELVRKVVSRHVSRGSIPRREASDAEMSVFEKFWNNRNKIFGAFQGKSQLNTYCIAVANRMCCEFIRKEKKHWNQLHETMETLFETNYNTSSFEAEKDVLFKNEANRLSLAFRFFNGESAKINLFLKYYLGIPVELSDVQAYSPQNPHDVLSFFEQNKKIPKGEKYEILAEVVNQVEKKEIKSDSVRMWLNDRMKKLLKRLNGEGSALHNQESITILMEMM